MEDKSHIQFNNLLYSCTEQKQRGNEQFVHEHAFGYIVSGEVHSLSNNQKQVFKQGMIGLVRRNQLVKSVKVLNPPDLGSIALTSNWHGFDASC